MTPAGCFVADGDHAVVAAEPVQPAQPAQVDPNGFWERAWATRPPVPKAAQFVPPGASEAPSRRESSLTVMTFNVLADQYARKFKSSLYAEAPARVISWQRRSRVLVQELLHWKPDIICLQEVEHFDHFKASLQQAGYDGVWMGRGGRRRDGCATFWCRDKLALLEQQQIRFSDLQLEDNVALLVRLQPLQPPSATSPAAAAASEPQGRSTPDATSLPTDNTQPGATDPPSSSQPDVLPQVVVGNTHICFDPARGDIKLGQMRTLFTAAHCLAAPHKALVILGGDYNTAPHSPLYHFMSSGQLDVSAHSRRKLSGQVKGWGYTEYFQTLKQQQEEQEEEGNSQAGGPQHQCDPAPAPGQPASTTVRCTSPSCSGAGTAARSGQTAGGQSAAGQLGGTGGGVQGVGGGSRRRPRGVPLSFKASGLVRAVRRRVRDLAAGVSAVWSRWVRDSDAWNDRALLAALGRGGVPCKQQAAVGLVMGPPATSVLAWRGGREEGRAGQPGAVGPTRSDAPGSRVAPSQQQQGQQPNSAADKGQAGQVGGLSQGPGQGSCASTCTACLSPCTCDASTAGDASSTSPAQAVVQASCSEQPDASTSSGGAAAAARPDTWRATPDESAAWTADTAQQPEAVRTGSWRGSAAGPRASSGRPSSSDLWWRPAGSPVALHPLPVRSSYMEVTGQEPSFSSTHKGYHGCSDFLWFTPHPVTPEGDQLGDGQPRAAQNGSDGNGHTTSACDDPAGCAGEVCLLPVRVLQPPCMSKLPQGLPAEGWGSDHIPLLTEFLLVQTDRHFCTAE